jgi:multidrug efflux pump subunit AcrB
MGGLLSYAQLPKLDFPTVTIPAAVVTAIYPGATAEDIGAQVARKVEDTAMEIDGFKECRTECYSNACAVTVILNQSMAEEKVTQAFTELRQKMDDLQKSGTLPSGVTSVMVTTDAMDTSAISLAVVENLWL